MSGPFASFRKGVSPILAVALHNGHRVRAEVEQLLKIDRGSRRREEDPYTGRWTVVSDNRIICHQSRFEVDLNRPRELAVYATPEAAWGLDVWHERPSDDLVERSLARFDRFYAHTRKMVESLLKRHPRIVVLDLHTYNHRRRGPAAPPDDPAENPEINLGTGTMDRWRWGNLVDRCLEELSRFDFMGRTLDVRENVRFQGGYLARRLHATFPNTVCVLAIEVKKFFMDEWTGELDPAPYAEIVRALRSLTPGLTRELEASPRGTIHAA